MMLASIRTNTANYRPEVDPPIPEQVDMTDSCARSRYRRARTRAPKSAWVRTSSSFAREMATRAASGIHPSDPRPTEGTQLETAPAIWKQRLDRDIARDTYHSADARGAEPGDRTSSTLPNLALA